MTGFEFQDGMAERNGLDTEEIPRHLHLLLKNRVEFTTRTRLVDSRLHPTDRLKPELVGVGAAEQRVTDAGHHLRLHRHWNGHVGGLAHTRPEEPRRRHPDDGEGIAVQTDGSAKNGRVTSKPS